MTDIIIDWDFSSTLDALSLMLIVCIDEVKLCCIVLATDSLGADCIVPEIKRIVILISVSISFVCALFSHTGEQYSSTK